VKFGFGDWLIEFWTGLRRGGDFSGGRLGRDADVAAAAAALVHAGAGGARQAPRVHRQLRILPLGGARRVSIDPAFPPPEGYTFPLVAASQPNQTKAKEQRAQHQFAFAAKASKAAQPPKPPFVTKFALSCALCFSIRFGYMLIW